MITVKVNGADSGINTTQLTRFTDLVELIKASIDPDHMISSILLNGQEADDRTWGSTLNPNDNLLIEVSTQPPETFVNEKMGSSALVVKDCYVQFRDARKLFQAGKMLEANQALVKAVGTAKSFFEWYAAIIQLIPAAKQGRYDIGQQVAEISEICKKICQQQLYQSWWALGETLEKELEPKLDKLEDFCRSF